MAAVETVTLAARSGVRLALLRLRPAAPVAATPARTIVALHATGFCKEVFLPFVDELRRHHEAAEVLAVDMRNHGDSAQLNRHLLDNSPAAVADWREMAEDVAAFVRMERHARPPAHQYLAVGHSGGGAIALLAEQRHPGTFDGIFAVEPIILDNRGDEKTTRAGLYLAEGAIRRRANFASREEVLATFRRKAVFRAWDDRALQLYATAGVRDRTPEELASGEPEMRVTLKCSPLQEKASFDGGTGSMDLYTRIEAVGCPALLIQGGKSLTYTTQDDEPATYLARMARRMPRGRAHVAEGMDHLMVMEQPRETAALFLSWLDTLGAGGKQQAPASRL